MNMKKKSLVMTVAAVACVAVVGIGATLAVLSDTTSQLTNTFAFTDEGIDITLDENAVKYDGGNYVEDGDTRIPEGQGNAYEKVLPNATLAKDPRVTVAADSLDCYVFVSIENANAEDVLAIKDLNMEAWEEVTVKTPAENTKYYIYKGAEAANYVVSANGEAKVLEDVFEHLTAGSDIDAETVFHDIVIKASAVQADNVTLEDAKTAGIELLGAVY
jgi:predicted ribosomally synthesized peptide with SipW-like signal peptide